MQHLEYPKELFYPAYTLYTGEDVMAVRNHDTVFEDKVVTSRLRSFISRRVDNSVDVDDIHQETMLRVFVKLKDTAIRQPLSYAFQVARNLITDSFRSKAMRVVEPLSDDMHCPQPHPEEAAISMERFVSFKIVLNSMPPIRREVFVRRRLQGQSCKDIADALGLSAKSVGKHIARALIDLRDASKF